MGRKSGISFFAERGGYFTTYMGQRERLHSCAIDDKPNGPHYLAAMAAFAELMQTRDKPAPSDSRLSVLIERWIAHTDSRCPATARVSGMLLKSFVAKLGHIQASQLHIRHVLDWAFARSSWGMTTKHTAVVRVRAALSWNTKMGYLTTNPLAGAYRPKHLTPSARGAEYLLPKEVSEVLLATAPPAVRDLLTALATTGARPAELTNALANNYCRAGRYIRHRGDEKTGFVHKNATKKKTGDRDRVIYVNDQVVELIERNMKTGAILFPTATGKVYTPANLQGAMRRLLDKPVVVVALATAGMKPSQVIPYSFRHTFITNAILRGVPIKTVADLTGTSVAMIEAHYSHATSDTHAMRAAFLRALGDE